jgi:hypothetical protein
VTTPTPGATEGLSWVLGATPPATTVMTLDLANVAALQVNTALARLPVGTIDMKSDDATTLGFEALPAGTGVLVDGAAAASASMAGAASVALTTGTHTIALVAPTAHPARTRHPTVHLRGRRRSATRTRHPRHYRTHV